MYLTFIHDYCTNVLGMCGEMLEKKCHFLNKLFFSVKKKRVVLGVTVRPSQSLRFCQILLFLKSILYSFLMKTA